MVQAEAVLQRSTRRTWWLLAVLWLGVNASFWTWWLDQSGTPWLYWPQTAALAYQVTVLPTFFFLYVYRMRRPVELAVDPSMTVAMITLCVPSAESLDVISGQLKALTRVRYPHDSWVLDEGASADVRALAEELGVHYFTRKDVPRWNEAGPPFQRATKAGNVNAWLDHIQELGLDYEVVVQLDVDHRPRPDYLERVLGYFRDRSVAWVQAPSVCGNLDEWAARGLAEQDMLFQGALQMGFYGATRTPFIIGSHTAYRTEAIREIGGFQPTRAEDHLDTVVLAAHGYRGVFVPRLIAVGSGPRDFATYLRQQFAWAHSMIGIFLRHTPRLLHHYSLGQAVQFLVCQSWYTLWSLSLGTLWAVPTVALVLRRPVADVSLLQFLAFFLPVPLMATALWFWSHRWFQPTGLRLSWRGVLLEVARWPVVLFALANVVLGIGRTYMITPKGIGRQGGPRLRSVYGPYICLTILPLAAIWHYALGGSTPLRGYYLLALFNGLWGAVLVVATLLIEFRSLAAEDGPTQRTRAGILVTVLSVVSLFAVTAIASWASIVQAQQ